MSGIKLSVVIPAYNEEARIQTTLRDIEAYLREQSYRAEIIIVVNGSRDRTYEIANELASTLTIKTVVMNLPAGGKGNAIKRGILDMAHGDFIVFMDADNATPISEIEKFWPYLERGYEVVIGSRYLNSRLVKRRQSFYRVILSRLSNSLIQVLLLPGIKDTQLGFKAFSQAAAKAIFPALTVSRWGFDMEVLTIAKARAYKIQEVGVLWTEHGHSHLPLKAYFESLVDLLKIKRNNSGGKYRPPVPRRTWLKAIKIVVITLILLAVAGMAFIKLDTPAAAEFTDSYLRPIIGDRQVIFLERIFFNFSDSVSGVVHKFEPPTGPQFLGQTTTVATSSRSLPVAANRLDLSPLPTDPAFAPLPGEGVWHNVPLNAFPNQEVMAETFVRPDATRDYAIVTIVKMDTSALILDSVAGIKEPGGKVGKPGPGYVPLSIVQAGDLIAAFDGGFQYRDGAYGMIVGDTVYLPLKKDMGTIIGYPDGRIKIFNYNGESLPSNLRFVRQNGPLLVSGGEITVTDSENRQRWGRVVGVDSYTWRSALGITAGGNLIYAAGNNLSPDTLAVAMKIAGAVDAIQLDINPYWVRFNVFNAIGAGKYNSYPLTSDMQNGSKAYLHGYQKDFFYIHKKLLTF